MFNISVLDKISKNLNNMMFFLLTLIAVAIHTPCGKALAIELAPHRAVYDMTLERSAAGSGVVELTGRMVYEITGNACQGYKQNTRFVTRSVDQSGQQSIMDLRSKFWEDGRGRTFRFDTDHYRNEQLTEKSAGTAERDDGRNGVKIRISSPQRKNLDLSDEILFPIQHTLRLLQAAHRGETIFIADIYDGSEKGAKVYATTAVMGVKKTGSFNADLNRIKNNKALQGLAAWPVSLAYFEQHKEQADAVPSYELGFLFYENGVARNLFIDYGHFAIRGKLAALEMLASSDCRKE